MAKLYAGINHITLVLSEEFLVFTNKSNQGDWEFQKIVKCVPDSEKSDDIAIECCAFSPCGKYFGVSVDKNIIIYGTFDWSILAIAPGERKASCMNFFPESDIVLVANKSGRAIFYSFDGNNLKKIDSSLGHNSMLTGAVITGDGKFVITCDRDEKIRVTNYPNVYNIERFCLGHKQFVSWVGFLPSDKRILVSCSGDGTIKFWNYLSGSELAQYDCNRINENDSLTETEKIVLSKLAMCNANSESILAVVEYKSNHVRILKVNADLNKISVELIKTFKFEFIPWDIVFFDEYLIFIMPNKEAPIIIWSAVKKKIEENECFGNLKKYVTDHFDFILNKSHNISDLIPVLFKREVDNLQEYEQRKRARLLKTGKSS